jgi:hypothetical protein
MAGWIESMKMWGEEVNHSEYLSEEGWTIVDGYIRILEQASVEDFIWMNHEDNKNKALFG